MPKNKNKDNICPHCLSKLLDEDGSLVCSGDKLKFWIKEFVMYEKLSYQDKWKYLDTLEDKGRFLDLLDKWNKDEVLSCEYTNKMFSTIPETKIILPDLLQVKQLERVLKRPLTEEELLGHTTLIVNGEVISIKKLTFPDDF